MGYKTKDPKEVMQLQNDGYTVVGIIPETLESNSTLPQLVYEFNFTKEIEQKKIEDSVQENITITKAEPIEIKRKAGRPKKEVIK